MTITIVDEAEARELDFDDIERALEWSETGEGVWTAERPLSL